MTFVTVALKLWHTLIATYKIVHHMCHLADRVNTRIQASTASTEIKTASTNVHTAVHTLCDLLLAAKQAEA